jgi:metal-responsive CopG/Arc/MetJ family transcriptional regulator
MVSVSIHLPDMVYDLVREVMEKEGMNRSNAIAYLIKMGYHYRYRVLEKAETEPSKGSRVSEGPERVGNRQA